MNAYKKIGVQCAALVALGSFATGPTVAATVDVYLRVEPVQIPANALGNNPDITMWGFVQTDSTYATPAPGSVPWAPGPTLSAAAGDTLNIHVRNALTGPYTEPVSVAIRGQTPALVAGTWPVWTDGSSGPRTSPAQRVRSFTTETPVAGEMVYTWPNLKAGTYLYESGTHPGVQVQMGLYGVLTVTSATPGQAYDDPSSAYDSEATLLFSEIDPVLHEAVATGNYGPGTAVTSPVDYHASYFLINGQAYSATAPSISAAPNKRLLLRFANAGLETKVPHELGPDMAIIAEDGNFIAVTNTAGAVVPAPRMQYSVFLPAGKTMDAILTPTQMGDIPLFDRRLNLTNAGATPGGMLTYLHIGLPTLAASPGTLYFGAVLRGTTSPPKDVTVSNSGNVVGVISAAITGTDASLFSVAPTGTVNVASSASTALAVTFAPPAPTWTGYKNAVLQITTNDPDNPTLNVNLKGQVTK